MSAQDLGTLADYVVNGDNYEKVQPDGSTLVIPGQYGRPPLAPAPLVDHYTQIVQDCPSGQCAVWVHDRTTGFYHIGPITQFNTELDTCVCALVSQFPGPTCLSDLQAQIDALAGRPVWELMPRWLLAELNIPITASFFPDFWFIACFDDEIIIPNLTKSPITVGCPPPGLIQLVNGVPVCMMDPPIPSLGVPRAFRSLHFKSPKSPIVSLSGRAPAMTAAQSEKASSIMKSLNPTSRPGLPVILQGCGCESGADFEEALP